MLKASKSFLFAMSIMVILLLTVIACGSGETIVEVTREVPVEQRVEVTKVVTEVVTEQVEVTKVVTEEVEVTKVVTEEVPVEVTKVVTEQVMMEQLDPLIIGALISFTGSLAEFGPPLRNAIELAADHVNRAGGIQGASTIVISRDTGVNPVQGVDSARALIDVENAVAIVGALSSGVTVAVSNAVVIPNERLLVTGASTAPSISVLEDNDFIFRTTTSDAAQGVVLARLAQEQGYEKVGIMYINNAYGEGLADQFEESFTELGGTVTSKVAHEEVQPTYQSELEKATEGDPDVLATMSYPGQAEVYIREAMEGGYVDKFLFVDAVKGPEWIDRLGIWEELDGTLGTVQGAPGSPQKDAFEESYIETFGFLPSHPFMAEHYDATVLIALAAAKAGNTTDSAAIRDQMRFVANPPGEVIGPGRDEIARALKLLADGEDINYEGAGGAVDFDENGDVFGTIEIWTVKDGSIQSTGRYELP